MTIRSPSWWVSIRRRVRLSHAVIVLCALLVGADGVSNFFSALRAYQHTISDAGAMLDAVARATDLTANRAILDIDATVVEAQHAILAKLPDVPLNDASMTTLLRQYDEQARAISNMLIVDAQGRVVNSSNPVSTRQHSGARRRAALRAGFAPGHSTFAAGWFAVAQSELRELVDPGRPPLDD
jgi:hypothetical protein